MNAAFYVRYAWRSFARAGQRSVLGVACIAFGVLSLVAMQLLAGAVREGVVVEPRHALGGDLVISRDRGSDESFAAELDSLRSAGAIRAHVLLARTPLLLLRRSDGGPVEILSRGLGVSGSFPLIGRIELRDQDAPGAVASVLARPGEVLITSDVARALGVERGADVLASDMDGLRSARLRVAGIIETLPDHRASSMLYGLATARLLGGDSTVRSAAVLTSGGTTAEQFRAAGWQVRTPADAAADAEQVATLFDLMLKGAGLLGLLVGAIGVVNTLYVTLARRTEELATLKTLGFGTRSLVALLTGETLLLGGTGSLLGTAAGLLVAERLAALLGRVEGALSVVFRPDPGILLGGLAVGIIMSVVFGLYATLRASAVRPAFLLRQQQLPLDAAARRRSLVMGAVLALTYAAVAALVLGSLLRALATVTITLLIAGLVTVLLAGALKGILAVPLPLGRTGMLARRGLGRRPLRAIAALAALAIGVFTIAFSAAVLLRGMERLQAEQRPEFMDKVLVVATPGQAPAVDALLAAAGSMGRADTVSRGGASAIRYTVQTTEAEALATRLAQELPEVLVIAGPDIAGFFARSVRGLFAFVAGLAGLALLAGVVLVANAVGLGLLERRIELAVLKAVGYSRARVLATIAAENTLLGLVGSAFGVGLATIAVLIINRLRPDAAIGLHLPTSLALLALGVALCQLTALAVAWRPSSLRPLTALREQ